MHNITLGIILVAILLSLVVLERVRAKNRPKRLYFGHPKNTYNTELEKRLLIKIQEEFPGYEIENPNQQHHQEGCEVWRKKTGNPMDYFTNEVLPSCQGGIFLPFRDDAWGAGVYVEAKFYRDHEQPLWKINADLIITPNPNLEIVRVLSVQETIARIRTPSKETIPY